MLDIDFKIPCWYAEGCHLKEDNCKKTCHRYLEMNCLITNCGMKNAYKYLKDLSPQKKEFEAYKQLKEIKDNIVDFVAQGKNLYISSDNIQTGKTTWALKMLYRYFDIIWSGNGFRRRGYFLHIPEFLENMRNFEYKDTAEFKTIDSALKNVDVVIWDDITANVLNPTEQSILYLYLSKRLMNDKSNIFTGIYRKEKPLEEIVGDKIANRIQTNCQQINLTGTSRTK